MVFVVGKAQAIFVSDSPTDDYVGRAVEITVILGLLVALAATWLLILRPFIPVVAWGGILAVAAHPTYLRLKRLLRGRGVVAAIVFTGLLLAIVIVPLTALGSSLLEGAQNIAGQLKSGNSIIPLPPAQVESWPLIGIPLHSAWELASRNLAGALRTFAPQIRALIPDLLSASAGIGLAALQWIFSILVAGVFLANGERTARVTAALSKRLLGERGPEFEGLASSTIRSVTRGIVGVAFIQSLFAAAGFVVAGFPGAGLWSFMFLIAAVLQVGVVVLIPAVIYMFAIADTTHAVMFLAWCAIVGVMDNVLKPFLLGREAPVPIIVVFLGTIGGFIALGAIGLFVGAVVLSVGYKLCLAWLEGRPPR
jgi:predicted PurR-regulated permease PerM